jgi:biotin synthase
MNRFHHNIETAPSFFPSICTSHTIEDKLKTIRIAKEVGLEICSGGIIGMGESAAQRIEFALTLRELDADSIPFNILNPIKGTPLSDIAPLHPTEILRTIAIFRFILPTKDITVCGGRETNLRDCLSWIFYAGANGTMTGGYLTTPGRSPDTDIRMITDLGLTVNE